jgi:hypothetical protein
MSDSATITIDSLPTPYITGPTFVCQNSTVNIYVTELGMTGYIWTVSSGGTITAGGMSTDPLIRVTWNTAGAQTVSVNYFNADDCTAALPAVKNVTVFPIPAQPGSISGPTLVCQGTTNTYTTSSVTGAAFYTWTLPPGWSGSSSSTSIDATAGPDSGTISVTATIIICSGPAQSKSVSVVIVPEQISFTNINVLNGQDTCNNASQTITVAGNGMTFLVQNEGSATMIAGQNIDYLPGTRVYSGGYMHGYIATGVCCGVGGLAPSIVANQSGLDSVEVLSIPAFGSTFFKVYPNPSSGNFILELDGDFASPIANVEIFGMQGEKILSTALTGERKREFSLSDKPAGIYFIRVISGTKAASAKIIKQ